MKTMRAIDFNLKMVSSSNHIGIPTQRSFQCGHLIAWAFYYLQLNYSEIKSREFLLEFDENIIAWSGSD